MNNDELESVIKFWREVALSGLLNSRDIVSKDDFLGKEVIDIVGVRRSGKSSVLKLLIKILQDKNEKNWLYVNFEDPYFLDHNKPQIIERLIEVSETTLGTMPKYIFLDEVQNINSWEAAVRKYRDGENCKIFVTGSSSMLLSRELGTLLTGRHLSREVFPLSFSEFLDFKNVPPPTRNDLAVKDNVFLKFFREYLQVGGFPEIAITGQKELLKNYYKDILQRDIINRHDIRDQDVIERMGAFLLTNTAQTVSLLSLQEQFKLSFQTVGLYWSYFLESLLLFELPKFSYSVRDQQKSLKKIYSVDTGLASAVSLSFSRDLGRMLENVAFLQLRRLKKELFYFKGNNDIEVDFIVKDREQVEEAIQVCWDFNGKKTLERELRGLAAAANLGFNKATILTYETKGEEKINGMKVKIIPVWRWILEMKLGITKQ